MDESYVNDDNVDENVDVERNEETSPKIQLSPELKKIKLNPPCSPISDSQTCPICFELWTNSGDHRISVLNCGHLYGFSCIKKWIEKEQRCPQCNRKAQKKHIKHIYTRSITVLDTAERDRALEELEEERQLRRKAEVEMATEKLKREMAEAEIAKLKNELQEKEIGFLNWQLQKELETMREHEIAMNSQSRLMFNSVPCAVYDIPGLKSQQCRVIKHLQYQNTLFTNCQMSDNVHGMIKFYLNRPSGCHEWIPSHKEPIKDLAFNPIRSDGLILSASTDKTISLTSILSNVKVQTFQCNFGAWSCTWDHTNASVFYGGLQNGRVLVFDIRQPKQEVHTIHPPNNTTCPVLAIQFVEPNVDKNFLIPSILVAQLNDIYFCELLENNHTIHQLPIKGLVAAVAHEPVNRRTMISLRPSKQKQFTQHLIGQLTMSSTNKASFDIGHCLEGGRTHTTLTKTALINSRKTGQTIACAMNENEKGLMIWDVASAAVTQCLPIMAVDVCSINTENQPTLATLTANQIKLFQHYK